MPDPVYTDVLTQESARSLGGLLHDLPSPVALAGGHAVRLRVADAWRQRFRADYFGSRDIDVCYEVRAAWSEAEFRQSAAALAARRLRELGFEASGAFRFVRYVDDDGRPLAREPASPKQLGTDYHGLFVDPMVSATHPLSKKVLGFTPIDDPVLQTVFDEPRLRNELIQFGPKVYLPATSVLVATKLKSLPNRTRDDKRIKDLCDLFALLRFGGEPLPGIRRVVHTILPTAPGLVDAALRHAEVETSARHLTISAADFRAVVGPLQLAPARR